jgi:rubrerythrin
MSSCLDLRQYQDSPDMASIIGKIVSGKSGYKAVIERKKEAIKCVQCGTILTGEEKFCPECGAKQK